MDHKMQCKCCDSKNTKVDSEITNNFSHYICSDCKFEFFMPRVDSAAINAGLYENDDDYNDDLIISKNYKSLLSWNHHTTTNFLSKAPNIK